jgi:putative membrane protein
MKKLLAPTIVTAAAVLSACGSDKSHYATSDNSGTYYTSSNDTYSSDSYDGSRKNCPMGSKSASSQYYDNGLPPSSRSYSRSSNGDYYTSSENDNRIDRDRSDYYYSSDRSLGEEMYGRDGMTGDPNQDYSSDAGCSMKKTGGWYGGSASYRNESYRNDNYRDENYRSDNYRSESDSYSSDSYASSPTPTATTSTTGTMQSSGAIDNRYTDMPGHYTNATPGGFSNASAWASNGARTEAQSPTPQSSSTVTSTTTSNQVVTPMATDTIALGGDLSADTRILSILNVKDQEEVEIGRLAATNASSQDVKDYATHLIKDHTEHGAKVRSVASTAGITLMDPDQVKATIAKEKGKTLSQMKDPVAELRDLKGSDFDQKFAMKMKDGHAKLIAMVEKAQYDVKNPNVKDLLAQTLPTLREHERMAAKLTTGENTDTYTSPADR